jgi:hypothetical protein
MFEGLHIIIREANKEYTYFQNKADILALEDDLNIPEQKCKCQDTTLTHVL